MTAASAHRRAKVPGYYPGSECCLTLPHAAYSGPRLVTTRLDFAKAAVVRREIFDAGDLEAGPSRFAPRSPGRRPRCMEKFWGHAIAKMLAQAIASSIW